MMKMVKMTTRLDSMEIIYEADTVKELVELKNELDKENAGYKHCDIRRKVKVGDIVRRWSDGRVFEIGAVYSDSVTGFDPNDRYSTSVAPHGQYTIIKHN